MAPTVLHSLGLAVPDAMQGRVLTELLQPASAVRFQPATVGIGLSMRPHLTMPKPWTYQERLRGLGYL